MWHVSFRAWLWKCQVVLYHEFLLPWPLFLEGSSTQLKTKFALIGFILGLWHLWESENQHSLSTLTTEQWSNHHE